MRATSGVKPVAQSQSSRHHRTDRAPRANSRGEVAASAKRERIVVAMSGGVDSAVAAARLHDAGYEVVGVTLHLWDYPDDASVCETDGGAGASKARAHGRCCAPEDQYDARRTADHLGFAHYTFDRRALFAERIVQPFVEAYLAGETPSPCSSCNRTVKLGELFAIADKLGARGVATGHYARIVRDDRGEAFIAEGRDDTKDQSYFLYATPHEQRDRLVFPLGESKKTEVRAEAIARNLPGARKGESVELCFVGAGAHAYVSFVEERANGRVRPGRIVDESGRALGDHGGIHRFTVGQRKGIGVSPRSPDARPSFVTGIDAATGTVTVGDASSLDASGAVLEETSFAAPLDLPARARVRVRYRHGGAMATIERRGDEHLLRFDAPVRAVTRGQIAVFYDGDRVVGGGRIGRAIPLAPENST